MKYSRSNELFAFPRYILIALISITYIFFASAVVVYEGRHAWESISVLERILLSTPLLWVFVCFLSIWLESGWKRLFLSPLAVILTILFLLMLLLSIVNGLSRSIMSPDLVRFKGLAVECSSLSIPCAFIALILYVSYDASRRNGSEFVCVLTLLQVAFMIFSYFSYITVSAIVLMFPLLLLEWVIIDFSGLGVIYFLYSLQVLNFILTCWYLVRLATMIPLILELKNYGYNVIPISDLWLLYKKKRASELILLPASDVDFDLSKCVRLNFEEEEWK